MLGVKKSMNRLIHMQKTNKSVFTASSRNIPAIISSSSSLPSYIFQQRNSLHIAIEETPNPKSIKFLPKNRAVIEPEDGGEDDTCWSFRDAVHNVEDVREGAPLAADILALDNVNEVMLTPNSITVNVSFYHKLFMCTLYSILSIFCIEIIRAPLLLVDVVVLTVES